MGTKEYKDQATYLTNNPSATHESLKSLDSAYVSPFHEDSGSAMAGYKAFDYNLTEEQAKSIQSNYSDQVYKTVGEVNAAKNKKVIGGTGDPIDPTIINNGLTQADLDKWWNALDKPWLNQNTNTGGGDDFMKMMMFMSMMRPQGNYGGSHYGYGNVTPGGVQSAYNPLANMSKYMDAFKSLPGISSNTINVTGT